MASEKVTALIEEVKALSVLELADLVHALEEAFGVSIRGREAMRLKSYNDGLVLIKSKLEQADGGNG